MPNSDNIREMVTSVIENIRNESKNKPHPANPRMVDAFADALMRQPMAGKLAKAF